jgi:integrase/recombinase XerD
MRSLLCLMTPRHRPLTQDEAERLASTCRTLREKRVIWTLLDTGLRVSELRDLTRERIAPESHYLYADAPGGLREIPITPRIAPLFDSWFSKHQSFGLSARSIERVVLEVVSRSGIERGVCAEALRHTFATAAARNGILPKELQRLLGHRHLASTEVYFHLARGGVIRPGYRSSGSTGAQRCSD